MRAKLLKLTLENFKGRTMSLDFSDHTVIRGTNEAGKSTLTNAFLWLLQGSDAQDRTNYELYDAKKELTYENVIPAVVEGVFDIDGREVKLRRSAKQKWVRKRGRNVYEKDTSDEYLFYIDDLAVPAKQYWAEITGMFAPLEKLKLMLNVRYYLTLDWKILRSHFSDLVGDVKEEDLEGDYSLIEPYLVKFDRNLAKAKEYLKQQKVPVDADLKRLDSEIEGAEAVLPSLDGVEEAESRLQEIRARKDEIDNEILATGDAARPYAEKREKELSAISDLQRELNLAESRWKVAQSEPARKIQQEIDNIKALNKQVDADNAERQRRLTSLKKQLEVARHNHEIFSEQRDVLFSDKEAIKARTFNENCICHTCGQPLPPGRVEELRKAFFDQRDADLKAVVEKGVKARNARDAQAALMEELSKEINEFPAPKSPYSLESLQIKLKAAQDAKIPFSQSPEYAELLQAIADAKANLTEVPVADVSTLKEEKRKLDEEADFCQTVIAKRQLREDGLKKIEDKKKRLSDSQDEAARLERLIDVCTKREREWADIVRSRANKYLSYSQVEMTEVSKAGETVDVCRLTARNVGAGTQNTATQVLIGIDVARAFQQKYGLSLPLFIDNAEQIVESNLPQVENQTVALYVDEKYKTLTVC